MSPSTPSSSVSFSQIPPDVRPVVGQTANLSISRRNTPETTGSSIKAILGRSGFLTKRASDKAASSGHSTRPLPQIPLDQLGVGTHTHHSASQPPQAQELDRVKGQEGLEEEQKREKLKQEREQQRLSRKKGPHAARWATVPALPSGPRKPNGNHRTGVRERQPSRGP
jgi:hypothetical protein